MTVTLGSGTRRLGCGSGELLEHFAERAVGVGQDGLHRAGDLLVEEVLGVGVAVAERCDLLAQRLGLGLLLEQDDGGLGLAALASRASACFWAASRRSLATASSCLALVTATSRSCSAFFIDGDDLLVGVADRLVLVGHLAPAWSSSAWRLGDEDLLLELLDLLLGDLALVDRVLDRARGGLDVAHQGLADLDALLRGTPREAGLELLLEFQLGVAGDEVAGGVLAADEPAEAAGVGEDDLLLDEGDERSRPRRTGRR